MKYPRPASEAELSIYHLLPFLFHLFEDLYSALALQWRPLVLHHIGVRIPAGTFIAVPRGTSSKSQPQLWPNVLPSGPQNVY